MLVKETMERNIFEFVDIESLVPKNHILRKIDTAIDFSKIYEIVGNLYCQDNGRPGIDPVILFKIVLKDQRNTYVNNRPGKRNLP